MALSDYERHMLEELEAQLADEDPSFAKTMKPQAPAMTRRQVSLRHLVIGLVIAAAGIGVLVGGIASELIVLGVVGVVIMFAGFWYAGSGMESASVGAAAAQAPAAASVKESGQSFMDRQAQRWERRQSEGE